jgi:hypothetical protein
MSVQLQHEAAAKFPYNTPVGYDYKAWAKRILWRQEQGDKELIPIQVKFAQEAINRGPEGA